MDEWVGRRSPQGFQFRNQRVYKTESGSEGMTELRKFYVCIGNGRPRKVEAERIPEVGNRFELEPGTVVEVLDRHDMPNGIQLQVERV